MKTMAAEWPASDSTGIEKYLFFLRYHSEPVNIKPYGLEQLNMQFQTSYCEQKQNLPPSVIASIS